MARLSWTSHLAIAASGCGLISAISALASMPASAVQLYFSVKYTEGVFSGSFSGENRDQNDLLTYDLFDESLQELTAFSATWVPATGETISWDLTDLEVLGVNIPSSRIFALYTQRMEDSNNPYGGPGQFDLFGGQLEIDGQTVIRTAGIPVQDTPPTAPQELLPPLEGPTDPNPPGDPQDPTPPGDPQDPTSVPEPGLMMGLLAIGAWGVRQLGDRP